MSSMGHDGRALTSPAHYTASVTGKMLLPGITCPQHSHCDCQHAATCPQHSLCDWQNAATWHAYPQHSLCDWQNAATWHYLPTTQPLWLAKCCYLALPVHNTASVTGKMLLHGITWPQHSLCDWQNAATWHHLPTTQPLWLAKCFYLATPAHNTASVTGKMLLPGMRIELLLTVTVWSMN